MGVSRDRMTRSHGSLLILGLLLALPAGTAVAYTAAGDPFPEGRPLTRDQAIDYLDPDAGAPAGCLTASIDAARSIPYAVDPAARRSVRMLQRRVGSAGLGSTRLANGIAIHFTDDPASFHRIDATDADGNGQADLLAAVQQGIAEARKLLVGQLELAAPEGFEIFLVALDADVDGYVVSTPSSARQTKLVLAASPAGGADAARRAAAHQYAHAVALSASAIFPAEWAEALATWTHLRVDGHPDPRTAEVLSLRLARLADGLITSDPRLAPGNALWLEFLEENYGPVAVRLTVDELSRGLPAAVALDRAVRRASGDELATAFREFHLWTLLVGTHADADHFRLATDLTHPGFASRTDGLPVLSVHADPVVHPLGATQVRLEPDAGPNGGLAVHFEGQFAAVWDVDLLLFREDGGKHRLPLAVEDGRAQTTVPLDGLASAWLLIRSLEGDGGRRYSYSAHYQPGNF